MDRRHKLLAGLALAHLQGAEIGPLDKPLVRRSDGAVRYIDYADAETLRRDHASDATVDSARIEVDVVWRELSLQQAVFGLDAPPPEARLDYLVASHVIEHVPDFVRWLAECQAVLKPTGELRLAVPDRRYTFDIQRRETRLADILAAFIEGDRQPSVRAILEHCLEGAEVDVQAAWAGTVDFASLKPSFPYERCIAAARDRHENRGYYPVHCWTFTPASFARLCGQLSTHGLLDFACSTWHDTAPGEAEFFVHLRPQAEAAAAPERLRSWQAMAAAVRG